MMKKSLFGVILALAAFLSGCNMVEYNTEETTREEIVTETVTEEQMIVEDKVVNAFLEDCDFDYGEIEKGNIKTKYYIHINECRTKLLNSATDELVVTIEGYNIENRYDKEVLEAFMVVVNTINENQDKEELENIVNGILEKNTDLYTGEIGNIKYDFKCFHEFEGGGVFQSRMEIRTTKYNVIE